MMMNIYVKGNFERMRNKKSLRCAKHRLNMKNICRINKATKLIISKWTFNNFKLVIMITVKTNKWVGVGKFVYE